MRERVGVFGGTFDPIHLGHLRAAECAREAALLGRVLFVPSGQPPHRQGALAAAFDRYAMVSLATAQHPHFTPSDLELRRDGPSYTVETLRTLRVERPETELFLVLGSDAFADLGSWHAAEEVAATCTVIVIERPGPPPAAPPALAVQAMRVAAPALEVSSSAVRRLRQEGKSVRYLVPEMVADYIDKRGLYR